jgi:hypothetical protein
LEVVVSIQFSDVEEAIIATYDLKHFVILDRMPTIFRDFNDECREIDNNIYLETFLTDSHAEPANSPTHAKAFEQEILSALEPIESYFNHRTISDRTTAQHLSPI